MRILEKGKYCLKEQDSLIITKGTILEKNSLENSTNLSIYDGQFNEGCLNSARRTIIYNGIFSPYCLTNAEDITIIGGTFDHSCLMNATNVKILGGNFGTSTLYNARQIKAYTNGRIESLKNITEAIIIIKELKELLYEDKKSRKLIESVLVYATQTENPIKNRVIKIDKELFETYYSPDPETLDDRIEYVTKILQRK